jgi:hypothetical protein
MKYKRTASVAGYSKMVEVFAASLTEPAARPRSLALVSMRVGARVVARAVDDPKLGDKFRDAAREHVLATTGWGDSDASGC